MFNYEVSGKVLVKHLFCRNLGEFGKILEFVSSAYKHSKTL